MFTDLLWYLGAKQQYNNQVKQGMAGLLGILSVIFIVWKWDTIFLPILDKLGLVDYAYHLGLVHEMPVITILNVTSIVFIIALLISSGMFLIAVSATIIMIIGQTKIGTFIFGLGMFLVFFPILIPLIICNVIKNKKETNDFSNTYKNDPELSKSLNKYKEFPEASKMFHLFKEQLEHESRSSIFNKLTEEEAIHILNRAVDYKHHHQYWLLSYNAYKDQWLIHLPNPLPKYASPCADEKYAYQRPENLFNYPKYDIRASFIEQKAAEDPGFSTLTIPVEFVWDNKKIVPKIEEHPKLRYRYSKGLIFYNVNSSIMDEFYMNIEKRYDVLSRMLHAHLVLYLIPMAFKENESLNINTHYNEMICNIPNVNYFSPIYKEAMYNKLVIYAGRNGNEWARRELKKWGD